MRFTALNDAAQTPVSTSSPSVGNQPPAQPAIPNAVSPDANPSYAEGRNAREAYEEWFNTLDEGDFHRGAAFWAAHRSDRELPSCHGGDADFQAGCSEAARRLAPSDIRRRADADFRRGWNSL